MSDARTLAFYDAEAPSYAASGPGGTSRWLAAFMDTLPAGARVLDLGCGGGRDAEAMLARGFDVDATDGSVAVAAQAERRLGRPVRVLRFDQLNAPAAYDGAWASASLLHVPLDGLADVLARVHAALKPGGVHAATYKAANAAGRDGAERYFNYPDPAQLRDAYDRAGAWIDIAITAYQGGGFADGAPGPWLHVAARRAR